MITIPEIDQKLAALRRRYAEDPRMREIIVRQARALAIAREKLEARRSHVRGG